MTDFEFTGLDSLYDYLERHATDFKYTHQVGDHFQKLRDKLAQLNDSDGTERAQWEVDAFNFEVKEGRLHWKFQGTDNKGNPFEYPSIEKFDEQAFAHFSRRQVQSRNPVLRARYSHILWEGPNKSQQFATDAIAAYLELVPIYEVKDKAQPDKHYGQDVVTCLEAAFILAIQSRTGISLAKAELLRELSDFPESSSSWFYARYNLTNLILENRKHFVDAELSGLPDICLKTAETLLPRNTHSTITMYELGQKVDQKLRTQTCDWNRKIAKGYETLMLRR